LSHRQRTGEGAFWWFRLIFGPVKKRRGKTTLVCLKKPLQRSCGESQRLCLKGTFGDVCNWSACIRLAFKARIHLTLIPLSDSHASSENLLAQARRSINKLGRSCFAIEDRWSFCKEAQQGLQLGKGAFKLRRSPVRIRPSPLVFEVLWRNNGLWGAFWPWIDLAVAVDKFV